MISSQEYARRRQRLIESIGADGVAIFCASPERQRSHDTQYPYRASSDVLYLTGFKEPESVVVVAPGHDDGDFILFVRDRDPKMEQWEGRRAGTAGALERFGADTAHTIDKLDEMLPTYLSGREVLYYTFGADAAFDARILGMNNKLRHKRNQVSAAPGSVRDARDLVHAMRQLKSEEEIQIMKRAAVITSEAHVLAMRACKPGMREYELQALIEFHFKRHGASFPAYTSIVGSGDNATILHYVENDDVINAGEVVLIDAGCELDYYAADITRSFPASGTFTPAQKDLYQAVLDAEMHAVGLCAPGLAYDQIQAQTARRLTQSLVDLGLLEGDADALYEDGAYRTYYPHSTGHWLGADVHDVGSYYDAKDTSAALKPGHVLTIEPGIYVPLHDERAPAELRGVGVRIEDDILITATGHENLTQSCPKEVSAIEGLVGSGVTLDF